MPDIAAINERNRQIAEEFRAHAGKVQDFASGHLLLLHSLGAKSRLPRVNPLAYLPDGGRYVIFASYQGSPHHPDWYFNLKAHPDTTIEVGTDTIKVRAVELAGEERDRLWAQQVQRTPRFGEYQERTSRKIPVIALVPLP